MHDKQIHQIHVTPKITLNAARLKSPIYDLLVSQSTKFKSVLLQGQLLSC